MDRSGDQWTGDTVDAEARGEAAQPDGNDNRADDRSSTSEAAPRPRSVDSAAADAVQLNDEGTPATPSPASPAASDRA